MSVAVLLGASVEEDAAVEDVLDGPVAGGGRRMERSVATRRKETQAAEARARSAVGSNRRISARSSSGIGSEAVS